MSINKDRADIKNKLIFAGGIMALIPVIANITTILDYFESNFNKPAMSKQIFNVNSNNQQNGITAGVVNFTPPPRHFDDVALRMVVNELDKIGSKQVLNIHIATALSPSAEANELAVEMLASLKKNGWNADGFDRSVVISNANPRAFVINATDNNNVTIYIPNL